LPVLISGNLSSQVGGVSLSFVGVFSSVLGGDTLRLLNLLVDSIGGTLNVGVNGILILEIDERESEEADVGNKNKGPKRKKFDEEVADQRKSKRCNGIAKVLHKKNALEFQDDKVEEIVSLGEQDLKVLTGNNVIFLGSELGHETGSRNGASGPFHQGNDCKSNVQSLERVTEDIDEVTEEDETKGTGK